MNVSAPTKASLFSPYRTRSIRPLGIMDVSPLLRMKGYGIHHSRKQDPLIDQEVLEGAQERVREVAVNEILKTNHHGVGFYIVHQGVLGTWLLIDWWTSDILLSHKAFGSTAANPGDFKPVDGSLACCTWEFAAMAHERDAWLKSHTSNLEDPFGKYISDFLTAEV